MNEMSPSEIARHDFKMIRQSVVALSEGATVEQVSAMVLSAGIMRAAGHVAEAIESVAAELADIREKYQGDESLSMAAHEIAKSIQNIASVQDEHVCGKPDYAHTNQQADAADNLASALMGIDRKLGFAIAKAFPVKTAKPKSKGRGK